MTGRQAVEYFAKLHHIGKIESIHFNIVPNRHYNPYDLISVHKNKVLNNVMIWSNLFSRTLLFLKTDNLFGAEPSYPSGAPEFTPWF
jgi:hypothetical protein